MNDKERAEQHNRNAEIYLEQTQQRYAINPASGIYEPHTESGADTHQSHPHQEAYRPASERPLANRAEIATTFIYGLGLVLSIATLIGLILTLGFTVKQWQEARRTAQQAIIANKKSQAAIDQARDQFREDQRPYIGAAAKIVTSPQFYDIPTMPGNGQIIWEWNVQNFGKSPALRLVSHSWMRLDKKEFKPSYKSDTIKHIPGILLPEDINNNTVISAPMAHAEFDRLMTVDNGIEIKVVWDYTDSSGKSYQSGLCFSHLKSNAIMRCEGNFIK